MRSRVSERDVYVCARVVPVCASAGFVLIFLRFRAVCVCVCVCVLFGGVRCVLACCQRRCNNIINNMIYVLV